ncbi:MAG: glycosyltransferase family 2 protein [Chloroflexota bacterium]|nr:glycosyltransferase family 2 protein [Chloroflexota bacterium]
MVDLAVIIVSYNVRELLAQTLRSLKAALTDGALRTRVLVVENQSHDGSGDMVRKHFPHVEVLEPGENLGFAGGNNLALRHLGFGDGQAGMAEFVWLLNPDTEVPSEAPQQLVEHLRAYPEVGAVGPQLRFSDGSFQHSAFAFPGLVQVALDLFPVHARLLQSRLNGRYPQTQWEGNEAFSVDMLLGASLMVRGATVDQVGLLDAGYFMYAEELDWCRRIHEAGWKVHALPSVTVVHHGGQSTQQFRDRMFVALWRSRLRYYEKWETPLYVAAVRALLRLGVAWHRFQLGRREPDDELHRRLAAYQEVATL